MYAKLAIVLLGMAVGAFAAGSNCSCSQLQDCVQTRFKLIETCRSSCEKDLPSGVAECKAAKKTALANFEPSAEQKATFEANLFKAGNGICETEFTDEEPRPTHAPRTEGASEKHSGNHTEGEKHHGHNETSKFASYHTCMRTCLNETHKETGEYNGTEESHKHGHPGAEGHHDHHREKKHHAERVFRHCERTLKCKIDHRGEKKAHEEHGKKNETNLDEAAKAAWKTKFEAIKAAEKTACECFHKALIPSGNATEACARHHEEGGKKNWKKGGEENGEKAGEESSANKQHKI